MRRFLTTAPYITLHGMRTLSNVAVFTLVSVNFRPVGLAIRGNFKRVISNTASLASGGGKNGVAECIAGSYRSNASQMLCYSRPAKMSEAFSSDVARCAIEAFVLGSCVEIPR